MKTLHFGTEQVLATPMTRLDYNKYRGWSLPDDEEGSDAGFLVERVNAGVSNHPHHVGYISWSPEDVFNRAYQPSYAMSFGHAIEAMKMGHKVARAGWNGKGMWIALTPGSSFNAEYAKPGHAAYHRAAECPESETQISLLAHIDMRAADGSMVIGWLASQTDMLANDWAVLS